jgi:hypothetical protein
MKIFKLSVFITFLTIFCSFNSNAQRIISNISVVLNTTNDDKDDNTYLECQVLTSDNHWLASNAGQFGLFPNNSTYTLNLNLGSSNYPETLLSQSALYVHIIPNGHDGWNFGWSVVVTYTDGTRSTSSGTAGLDQNNTSFRLIIFK